MKGKFKLFTTTFTYWDYNRTPDALKQIHPQGTARSFFAKTYFSVILFPVVFATVCFINFGLISSIVLGNDDQYRVHHTVHGILFKLFYIGGGMYVDYQPSGLNILLTILVAIALAVWLTRKLVWQNK